ncbi:hypothetical protein F1C76_12665 [Geodermatophilaceae bacterium NBWT11]|nr:hypothetical protein F1C76_12665 [Geodermatophilaceae bacterium NBWT11]
MTASHPAWTADLVSRQAALAGGRSPEEVRALLRSGTWSALRPGQYCPTAVLGAADPGRRYHLDLLALLRQLDRPGAVLARSTAGYLHGLLLPAPRGRQVHQLVDPGRTRHGNGYRMTRAALPVDQVTRLGPFAVTAVARTVVDCLRASWSPAASTTGDRALVDAVALVDDALLRGLVTVEELHAVLRASPTSKRTPTVQRALALADGRAESWLESAWRVRHLTSGLVVPELQVEIWIDGALVKVVDGWLPEHAVAFETDGKTKYTDAYDGRSPAQVAWEEKRLEDQVRAVGIRVVRPTVTDVFGGWPALHARVARMIAAPVPRLEAFTAVPRAAGRVRPGAPRWAAYPLTT